MNHGGAGSSPAVAVEGLHKRYGTVDALRGVDLQVARGTIFSLLGPNGAGKTTIVRILTTLTPLSSGSAFICGFDVVGERQAVRSVISLAGQHAAVDLGQTGVENLVMVGRLAGLTRREARRRGAELIDQFDLGAVARRRVGTYSGGTRRRLDLAASLTRPPQVLFLDEPTTGVDLRGRLTMWSAISQLAREGVTVFLTTQYLEEADQLADRIAVIDAGRVVAEGSPAELKLAVSPQRLDVVFEDALAYDRALALLGKRVVRCDRARRSVSLGTDGSASHVRQLLDELDPARAAVKKFDVVAATLDDVFLALTRDAPIPKTLPCAR